MNIPTFLAFFTSLGIWFQLTTTLLEQKFLLTSSLSGLGPSLLLVALSAWAAIWLTVNFVYTFHYLESLKHVRMCREQTVLCRLKKEARRDEDDLDLEPSRERDSDT